VIDEVTAMPPTSVMTCAVAAPFVISATLAFRRLRALIVIASTRLSEQPGGLTCCTQHVHGHMATHVSWTSAVISART